jgi:small-conductance mechanosensitive channel
VVGLSFAFGGTVSEFVAACAFVFVKDPYDVGDLLKIKDQELQVVRKNITNSIFLDKDKRLVQIPHTDVQTEWITNYSRSKKWGKRRFIRNIKEGRARDELKKERTSAQNERGELLASYNVLSEQNVATSGQDAILQEAKRQLEIDIENVCNKIQDLDKSIKQLNLHEDKAEEEPVLDSYLD